MQTSFIIQIIYNKGITKIKQKNRIIPSSTSADLAAVAAMAAAAASSTSMPDMFNTYLYFKICDIK